MTRVVQNQRIFFKIKNIWDSKKSIRLIGNQSLLCCKSFGSYSTKSLAKLIDSHWLVSAQLPKERTSLATQIQEFLVPIHVSQIILAADQHYRRVRTEPSDLWVPDHFAVTQ